MRQGASPLYVGREGRPAGAIMVADSLKPDSLSAVDNLKRMHMRVVMLTGDNAATARHMAEELHIDEVVSDVLPDEKASHIMKMEKAGARVAMVGDGVNDAPALACAQVGISLKSGTDLAMESSDIVLMKNHPRGVAEALQLGRATLHIIRQNLFWAFFYNTIGKCRYTLNDNKYKKKVSDFTLVNRHSFPPARCASLLPSGSHTHHLSAIL